jgi:formylglycine-generating enzyme required for sulfatase activity
MDFKNLFSKTANKTEAGSHQEITTISDIKDSTVKITNEKNDIDAGNYIEGNVSGGNIARRDIINNYYCASDKSLTKEELKRYMEDYLYGLMATCASLDWFEQVDLQDEKAQQVKLDSVYTALLTTTLNETKKDNPFIDKQNVSAVEMLNRHDKLVIAGAPGSGKSAFVNFVTLCMAGELLQSEKYPHCNLALFTQPLPDEEGKPQEQKQQWQHGALIPLRIILRDFASSTYFPVAVQNVTAQSLLDFIEADLSKVICKEFYPLLKKCLSDGDVLVMFDGLDEVPEADKRREVMKKCIESFCKAYSRNRFLITVRPYAYQETRWKITQFTETSLANFSRGQICLFIDLWYQDYEKLTAEINEKRTAELKNVIFNVKALQDLAERPLLLTLIAFLHRNRHELPHRRAALYKELLELLIKKWEKARFAVNDADEAMKIRQPSLSAFLQISYEAIYLVLERLAFNAHAKQKHNEKGVADIAEETLIVALDKLTTEGNSDNPVNAALLRHHLRDRVGILNLRGGDNQENSVYSFPHRSFQEYLAASYLSRGEKAMYDGYVDFEKKRGTKWYDFAAFLLKNESDRWREVVVLAGAIHAEDEQMAGLIDALIKGITQECELSLEQSWGLRFAGEILAENINQNSESDELDYCRQDLQSFLPKLLISPTLKAAERVAAGRHLAKIGDIRPEITELDAMPFCLIPKGEFYLGGDDKAYQAGKNHGIQTIDYDYALARFPVTVAQYRQFVEASNHQMEDEDCLRGLNNTPVVWVSWDEAIKFCDWLTVRWQQAGYLAKDWRVDLPSEAEWEKAAKGGLQIPVKPEMMTVVEMKLMTGSPLRTASHVALMDNPLAQRFYPWGNEIDHEKLNYEGRVNGVSTPACYPLGQSPYGCEEMAGNVWEWTRSAYEENYPDNQSEWQKRNARNQSAVRRVLRGGAFRYNGFDVRCAARGYNSPSDRSYGIGFRVVLCPHTSER